MRKDSLHSNSISPTRSSVTGVVSVAARLSFGWRIRCAITINRLENNGVGIAARAGFGRQFLWNHARKIISSALKSRLTSRNRRCGLRFLFLAERTFLSRLPALTGEKFTERLTIHDGVADKKCRLGSATLWDPNAPQLYRVEFTLRDGSNSPDVVHGYFGMRSLAAMRSQNRARLEHSALMANLFICGALFTNPITRKVSTPRGTSNRSRMTSHARSAPGSICCASISKWMTRSFSITPTPWVFL